MPTGTLTPLEIVRGCEGYALRPSNYVLSRSLAAGVAESFTIPTSPRPRFVLFGATADFFADFDSTAVVPGDVTNGTAPELNPALRFIPNGCTAISVISSSPCIVTASFWTD